MKRTATLTPSRTAAVAVVFALALGGAACIVKDTRSVIYLAPDGSATWTIFESDVRSDAKEASERAKEEEAWRTESAANPSPLAALLESLGGRSVSKTVLKDTVPFEVHTTARFDRIEALFDRLCAAGGFYCVSRTERDGERTTLTVDMLEELDVPGPERNGMNDALSNLKIVLTDGRLITAKGFVLIDERSAKLDEKAFENDTVTLKLTWAKDRQ